MAQTWSFTQVEVLDVHDGDTVHFKLTADPVPVWPGFSVVGVMGPPLSCRLAGYAALELKEPGGIPARDYLIKLLAFYRSSLGVTVAGWDKYGGRYDAVVWTSGGWLHDLMCSVGYGAPWDGRGAQPKPVWPIP